MTAIECLQLLRKGFIFLLIWNLVLSFIVVAHTMEVSSEKLNQQICNLEAIPDFEIVEVD